MIFQASLDVCAESTLAEPAVGLVARTAIASLAQTYRGKIEIYTFGTPHQGTPLAAIGGKFLNLLFKLGEDFAGAIPLVSPLAKAYGHLYDQPTLPPGLEVMREDSDALAMLNAFPDRYSVRSWGSEFDINTGPSGFGVGIEGLLAGALNGKSHDLVVPTASALGAGTGQPVLNCSHVHYFSHSSIIGAIKAFRVPVPPAMTAPPPPSPPATPPASTDSSAVLKFIKPRRGGIILKRETSKRTPYTP